MIEPMLVKPTERLDVFYHSQGEKRAPDIVALCPPNTPIPAPRP